MPGFVIVVQNTRHTSTNTQSHAHGHSKGICTATASLAAPARRFFSAFRLCAAPATCRAPRAACRRPWTRLSAALVLPRVACCQWARHAHPVTAGAWRPAWRGIRNQSGVSRMLLQVLCVLSCIWFMRATLQPVRPNLRHQSRFGGLSSAASLHLNDICQQEASCSRPMELKSNLAVALCSRHLGCNNEVRV
jgi:hypothetical protein